MSLVIPEKLQHILRIMNTNIDGKRKVTIAMPAIKGVGRRYATTVLKKTDVDLTKRAGECIDEEVDKIVTIIQNARHYKIPNWFLNRQKDIIDFKYTQFTSSYLDSKLRDDLEYLKKIRAHRISLLAWSRSVQALPPRPLYWNMRAKMNKWIKGFHGPQLGIGKALKNLSECNRKSTHKATCLST